MQVETVALELASTTIAYRLKRSPRRRRTMEISFDGAGGVTVAVPMRTAQAEIEAFLRSKQGWLRKRLEEQRNGVHHQPERSFSSGESIPYLGRDLPLCVTEADDVARTSARLLKGRLEVRVVTGQDEGTRRGAIRSAIERWYRARARAMFLQRVRFFTPQVGAEPRRVVVKAQKTRWGSCGPDGTLRFNWCLVMAPPPLIDYLVVHELCHLRRPGHGKAFWRLVAKLLPDYELRRTELRREGASYRWR